VHPSPAERFYLEHEYRQQQIWAGRQAEMAHLNAAVATQIANRISGTVQVGLQEGAYMHYDEQTFNIGSVQIKAGIDSRLILVVPAEFGTALSFVATLSNGGRESGGQWLWWSFHTSVDGLNWSAINAPGATSFLIAQTKGAATTRQHGPFGNRIAVKLGCKNSNSLNDDVWLHGTWLDLRLTMGVQRI
jgi:hypothetical protein